MCVHASTNLCYLILHPDSASHTFRNQGSYEAQVLAVNSGRFMRCDHVVFDQTWIQPGDFLQHRDNVSVLFNSNWMQLVIMGWTMFRACRPFRTTKSQNYTGTCFLFHRILQAANLTFLIIYLFLQPHICSTSTLLLL